MNDRLKRTAGLALILVACAPRTKAPVAAAVTDPASYADPRMGSGGYGFAYGAAYPGATFPNGMMRVGPDTKGLYTPLGFLSFSGYWAGDEDITAFSHLHLHGTGAHDYGVLGLMPVPAFDARKLRADDYSSHFAKSSEQAEPGYYAVTLDNGPILSEFAATTHAALEHFTFPGTSHGTLVVDLDHRQTGAQPEGTVTLVADQKLIQGDFQTHGGMSGGFHLYFVMKFEKGWTASHTYSDGVAPSESATSATGTGVATVLDFDVSDGKPLGVQVGLSLISLEGAKANLQAEVSSWDFTSVRAAAKQAWNDRLTSVTVSALPDEASQRDLQTFYSSLHHLFVMPGVYSDVDGTYRYGSTTDHATDFRFVTDLSLWDTYRTANPLYDLVAPDVALDIVKSLHAMARISGHFPKWPLATSDSGSMLGAGADIVLADAYTKGIRNFDAEGAYQLARNAAMGPSPQDRGGRNAAADSYMANSFVTAGDGASVSLTCEYSQDDFALGQLAAALGHADDAATLALRSQGYRHLFDPSSGLLREHTADGVIPANASFNASNFSDEQYVESDAYQSQFCVQHDIDGFAALWGGKESFIAGLANLFEETRVEREKSEADAAAAGPTDDPNFFTLNLPPSYYFGGNEPDVHYAYLFARAGRPDLTQKWIPWVRRHYFSASPTGLAGNDDGGTMTAWFVFSALGIYPVPGSDEYIVGTPLFPKADLKVAGGVFSISASGVSDKNIYVQSARLNGQPLNVAALHHADLKAGGSLEFIMGPSPSRWGRTD